MQQRKHAPKNVDRYEHYYAVSVAFTKGGIARMGLTEFHFDPRQLTTTELGWAEVKMASTNQAVQWLTYALEKAEHLLVPESRPQVHPDQLRLL